MSNSAKKLMMPNKKTLVMGLGKSGVSTVCYLQRQCADYLVFDTRAAPVGLQQLQAQGISPELYLENFDDKLLSQVQEIILSPGLSLQEPLVQKALALGISVIGDVELFARQNTKPVIAITGSNGKSTVTKLVWEMALAAGHNAALGGNIGTPVLDLLQQDFDLYVLELSSFQLETLQSLKPVAATVLNISADHMDRYADLNAYAQAKLRLFDLSKCGVWNADDEMLREHCANRNDNLMVSFCQRAPASGQFGLIQSEGETWLAFGDEKLMATHEIPLVGKHNYANCLAALALGKAAGFPMQAMLAAIRNFKGLPHRAEVVLVQRQVTWVNDSKGTNVGATLAALEGMENPVILIAGGQGKGADFAPLGDGIASKVKLSILMGEDADQIEQAIAGRGQVARVDSLRAAIEVAKAAATPGDVVLLSPACASFDMFNNFEHRGEVFTKLVLELCQ